MIDTAFISHVESNVNRGGESIANRPLEEEAIKCFSSWRKMGGKWKDMPIYAICHTNNPPSENTLNEFKNLDVTFVDAYDPISETFPAGWWNVPLSGMWAEDNLNHDFLVHTDLDMVLLKEPDDELMYCSRDNHARCAVYSENFPDDMAISEDYRKLFVTCFITSWSKNKFYTCWYEEMMRLKDKWDKHPVLDNTQRWWQYCNLEEHAVDVMYYEKEFRVEQVQKCQIGNGNAYDTVDSLTDAEMLRVFFNHDHFHDDCKQQTIKEYIMRMMELKRAKT
jgi:hypothetical protein